MSSYPCKDSSELLAEIMASNPDPTDLVRLQRKCRCTTWKPSFEPHYHCPNVLCAYHQKRSRWLEDPYALATHLLSNNSSCYAICMLASDSADRQDTIMELRDQVAQMSNKLSCLKEELADAGAHSAAAGSATVTRLPPADAAGAALQAVYPVVTSLSGAVVPFLGVELRVLQGFDVRRELCRLVGTSTPAPNVFADWRISALIVIEARSTSRAQLLARGSFSIPLTIPKQKGSETDRPLDLSAGSAVLLKGVGAASSAELDSGTAYASMSLAGASDYLSTSADMPLMDQIPLPQTSPWDSSGNAELWITVALVVQLPSTRTKDKRARAGTRSISNLTSRRENILQGRTALALRDIMGNASYRASLTMPLRNIVDPNCGLMTCTHTSTLLRTAYDSAPVVGSAEVLITTGMAATNTRARDVVAPTVTISKPASSHPVDGASSFSLTDSRIVKMRVFASASCSRLLAELFPNVAQQDSTSSITIPFSLQAPVGTAAHIFFCSLVRIFLRASSGPESEGIALVVPPDVLGTLCDMVACLFFDVTDDSGQSRRNFLLPFEKPLSAFEFPPEIKDPSDASGVPVISLRLAVFKEGCSTPNSLIYIASQRNAPTTTQRSVQRPSSPSNLHATSADVSEIISFAERMSTFVMGLASHLSSSLASATGSSQTVNVKAANLERMHLFISDPSGGSQCFEVPTDSITGGLLSSFTVQSECSDEEGNTCADTCHTSMSHVELLEHLETLSAAYTSFFSDKNSAASTVRFSGESTLTEFVEITNMYLSIVKSLVFVPFLAAVSTRTSSGWMAKDEYVRSQANLLQAVAQAEGELPLENLADDARVVLEEQGFAPVDDLAYQKLAVSAPSAVRTLILQLVQERHILANVVRSLRSRVGELEQWQLNWAMS